MARRKTRHRAFQVGSDRGTGKIRRRRSRKGSIGIHYFLSRLTGKRRRVVSRDRKGARRHAWDQTNASWLIPIKRFFRGS